MKNTIIYEYGARLDCESETIADTQFFLARNLYNECISIIKKAREDAEAYVRQCEPEIAEKCKMLEIYDTAFLDAKKENNEAGMKQAKADKKALWIDLKPLMKDARKKHKEKLQEFYAVIGMKKECLTYQARCDYVAQGLGSTTADDIHATALKAWDKVRKDGGKLSYRSARLRTQDHIINRFTCAGGVDAQTLLTGKHKMFAMEPPPAPGNRKYGDFSFRLGNAKAGQYATGTFQYHRPFPEGTKITVVRLIRKRVASKINWSLQFQMSVPRLPVIDVKLTQELGAIHLGFSLSDNGYRQIGAIASHVDSGFAEKIELDDAIPKGFFRVNELQSELDIKRDDIHALIKNISPAQNWEEDIAAEWSELRKLNATQVSLPRLFKLSRMITDAEWDIDSTLKSSLHEQITTFTKYAYFKRLEIRHLHKKIINKRKLYYRRLALKMVHNYKIIAVSRFDLKQMALRIKEDGERNELGQLARTARHNASLGEFLQCLNWAAIRAGATVIEDSDCTYASQCSACGATIEKHDDFIDCPCGHNDNAKANAAAGLFKKWQSSAHDKAAEIKQTAIDKQAAAETKQADKLERMLVKRKLSYEIESEAA